VQLSASPPKSLTFKLKFGPKNHVFALFFGMELRKMYRTTAELDVGQLRAALVARKQQIVISPDYRKQNEVKMLL